MTYSIDDPFLNLKLYFINDIPVLFTDIHIIRIDLPSNIYCYGIRHDDESLGEPCTIENTVFVNHYGDIVSKIPLKFKDNQNYIEIRSMVEADINISLEEYMK